MKLSLVFLLVSSVFLTGKAKAPDYVGEAKQVVSNLAAGRFDAVEGTFTPQMAQALPEGKLKDFWTGLVGKLGAYRGIEGTSVTEQTGYHTVVVDCKFAKQEVGLALTFDDSQKLAGIHIVPAPAKASRLAPSPAPPSNFAESLGPGNVRAAAAKQLAEPALAPASGRA